MPACWVLKLAFLFAISCHERAHPQKYPVSINLNFYNWVFFFLWLNRVRRKGSEKRHFRIPIIWDIFDYWISIQAYLLIIDLLSSHFPKFLLDIRNLKSYFWQYKNTTIISLLSLFKIRTSKERTKFQFSLLFFMSLSLVYSPSQSQFKNKSETPWTTKCSNQVSNKNLKNEK